MRYKLGLIISVIILLLVVFNLPTKEEKELKTDTLIAYIDGRRTDTIPTKSNDITVDRIVCDNNADAEWDNVNWGIYISDITNNSTKCSVYFKTFPAPELYTGLIPVTYDASGNTVVADTSTEWYDYDNHIWANAVLGTSSARSKTAGQILSDSEILQYYVWIPRYRYQLFNANAGESSDEQMINIEFEYKGRVKSTGSTNGNWLTHPAFTFGNTELNGFWVGKFEPSHSDSQFINASGNKLNCTNENCANASGIIIKPNVISIVNNSVSNFFFATRSFENLSTFGLDSNEVDTHMMKNMEWGAVAYLSASKYGLYQNENTCYNSDNNQSVTINGTSVNRCEIWVNNTHTGTGCGADGDWSIAACGGTITGCSAKNTIDDAAQPNRIGSNANCNGTQYEWNGSLNNGRSSTTGNVYGIYDMSGGTWKYVMADQSSSTTEYVWYPKTSGFASQPNNKYYDSYLASIYTTSESTENQDQGRGHLGDATRETMKVYGNVSQGWFGDSAIFISTAKPWMYRGGYAYTRTKAGIFHYDRYVGQQAANVSFRVVMTAEDN